MIDKKVISSIIPMGMGPFGPQNLLTLQDSRTHGKKVVAGRARAKTSAASRKKNRGR